MELGTEVREKTMACSVIFVTISISAEEVWGIWILQSDLLYMSTQVNKRRHELVLFA